MGETKTCHFNRVHSHLRVHTLPAAKISPGADADNFVEQRHGECGTCDVSCHDADRENQMMMMMMNAPHEPIPLEDEVEWFLQPQPLLDTVNDASVISDCNSNSGCNSECSDCSDESVQELANASLNNPHNEETDLREFLMDTFEEVDVIDYIDDLPQQAI
jgi:hypothetical protein